MTYKTRQEIFRAAADWMDVCAAACVKARFKFDKKIENIDDFKPSYDAKNLSRYEFPLALLEGKEVWVGDKAYYGEHGLQTYVADKLHPELWSWNPPKPKTVMVELDLEIVEHAARLRPDISPALTQACKKALENLK